MTASERAQRIVDWVADNVSPLTDNERTKLLGVAYREIEAAEVEIDRRACQYMRTRVYPTPAERMAEIERRRRV